MNQSSEKTVSEVYSGTNLEKFYSYKIEVNYSNFLIQKYLIGNQNNKLIRLKAVATTCQNP